MSEKQQNLILRIALAAALLTGGILLKEEPARTVLLAASYLVSGWDVLWRAARNITRGRIFDENFLMSVATIGAFGIGDFAEGAAVMLFYQTGELFQNLAVERSRKSISDLMDIRPDSANVEHNGELVEVSPEEVAVGDIIVVKPGERIPIDGIVVSGNSILNTSSITGESAAVDVETESAVVSGCVNISAPLRIRTTKIFSESTVSKILDLVENASNRKAKSESFISRFARIYTPSVVLCAALLALVPPLFFGQAWAIWINRALIFLVISCPCALVISVPLSFFCGMGGASRHGILVKGANYLDTLSHITTVVFDKTGTLTKGVFEVTTIHPEHLDKAKLLELAACAELYSDHPIAQSIKAAYGKTVNPARVSDVCEHAGRGISAVVDGHNLFAGTARLMTENGVEITECDCVGTIVHIAVDGEYIGHITISDRVKESAALAISELRAAGVKKTVMLTGDARDIGNNVAAQLGLDEAHCELLPTDKVDIIERLLSSQKPGERLAFVGDGINDAPVLARADLGIAMGALGSDAAIEAADVVLMDDNPLKISQAIRISRKTRHIVTENVVFALGVKFAVLTFGALGFATMWLAVFADVGVSVLAILNAMRAASK
ncbi:MAG: heavy metal translocating P-type ATPase [Oscillospiraceae bacterium]